MNGSPYGNLTLLGIVAPFSSENSIKVNMSIKINSLEFINKEL